jgi:hypothetical protein
MIIKYIQKGLVMAKSEHSPNNKRCSIEPLLRYLTKRAKEMGNMIRAQAGAVPAPPNPEFVKENSMKRDPIKANNLAFFLLSLNNDHSSAKILSAKYVETAGSEAVIRINVFMANSCLSITTRNVRMIE